MLYYKEIFDMSVQSEELKRYFAYHSIRNKDIMDTTGLDSSTISNMLAGRDSIGKNRAIQLHEAYGFSIRFLMTGEGALVPNIAMTPEQLKARAELPNMTTPPTQPAIVPPMIDASADMVTILAGQVQQLTSMLAQLRAENLSLKAKLDDTKIV